MIGTTEMSLDSVYSKGESDSKFATKTSVEDIVNVIGTDTLFTTATTLKGAINEVKGIAGGKADKSDIPETLPANGGNADTVNNHTVKSDVPENAVFTDTVYDDTEVNAKLNGKADKNAVLNSLEIVNGYTTAQIIPWSDGTHYRSFEDKSSNTYTDIVTNNGIALIARTENGKQTKSAELATMDKVVKDSRTTIITLYNNATGAFLKSDMNLTATKSGILKVSFNKKETGNTLNIYINGIHKYAYPNWWGENIYETAYIPVNNGDKIRISADVSGEGDWYRIVNVLII